MLRYRFLPGNPGVTLFDAICDMDNLRLAHQNASRGKSFYKEVKMVNSNPDYYLKQIQDSLLNRTFTTSPYNIFQRMEGEKLRTIYKLPYYPDRIVQWAILQIIGSIMERHFIYDTYSSIKGKGPLACMQRIHQATYYYHKRRMNDMDYYLKMDIRKFYPSIDHERLKHKYLKLFKDPNLLGLIFNIIDSVLPEEGIPIGNYLSQFSGNLYLSEFDHVIKEVYKIKHYYRYMDDMVLFGDNAGDLNEMANKIIGMLSYEGLIVKPNYLIRRLIEGLDFVGYKIFPTHILLRKRIKMNLKRKCVAYNGKMLTLHRRSSIGSLRGFAYHANGYNLQKRYTIPLYVSWMLSVNKIGTIYKHSSAV